MITINQRMGLAFLMVRDLQVDLFIDRFSEKSLSREFVKKVIIGIYEAEINVVIHSYGGTCDVEINDEKMIKTEDDVVEKIVPDSSIKKVTKTTQKKQFKNLVNKQLAIPLK